MTYHPNDPQGPPPGPPYNTGPGYPPPVTPQLTSAVKANKVPWIVGGAVAVVLICCGGVTAISLFAPDPAPEPTPAPSAAAAAPGGGQPARVAEIVPSAVQTPSSPTTPPALPPPPATAAMPDLREMNAAVAVDKLEKLGFARDNIRLGSQDELDTWVLLPENWTVVKQSDKPGAEVRLDSVIALTCTKQR